MYVPNLYVSKAPREGGGINLIELKSNFFLKAFQTAGYFFHIHDAVWKHNSVNNLVFDSFYYSFITTYIH